MSQKGDKNKNQHFVPRCYLRPFCNRTARDAIALFNIDRRLFVPSAPLKSQCSRSYFYGNDDELEAIIQMFESGYSNVLRIIQEPGYVLTDKARDELRQFWWFQYMRTEAASRRLVEMTDQLGNDLEIPVSEGRLNIKEAVQESIRIFAGSENTFRDMKICLVKNRASLNFIASDDPAILTNRWYQENQETRGSAYGAISAGNILILPMTPRILCIGYDGDVYSIPHKKGWTSVSSDNDVHALNEHQH